MGDNVDKPWDNTGWMVTSKVTKQALLFTQGREIHIVWTKPVLGKMYIQIITYEEPYI